MQRYPDQRSRSAKPVTIHGYAQSGDLLGFQKLLRENPSLLNERNAIVRSLSLVCVNTRNGIFKNSTSYWKLTFCKFGCILFDGFYVILIIRNVCQVGYENFVNFTRWIMFLNHPNVGFGRFNLLIFVCGCCYNLLGNLGLPLYKGRETLTFFSVNVFGRVCQMQCSGIWWIKYHMMFWCNEEKELGWI